MVMSQGTYTFLTCFAGFWLIWALIVMLCCFCSFLRRRIKQRREERLREQSLRTLEMDPVQYDGYTGGLAGITVSQSPRYEPHHPQAAAQRPWTTTNDSDLSKPPCYEEAVLMAEPPPPYSEVLSDTRGIYRSMMPPVQKFEKTEKHDPVQSHKPAYPSFIQNATADCTHQDSSLRSSIDFNRNHMVYEVEPYRRGLHHWTDSGFYRGFPDQPCRIQIPLPMFGRTTAV
ncbi:proline-rich protein 7 [Protopterus annectens]|uniref:proline-rich protein 7 n=1 Tax=Protopterus annectens TaxID=7888 RepID=UPI001CFAE5B8|nr:proline-rich protein 7 [Protopterus annectens]